MMYIKKTNKTLLLLITLLVLNIFLTGCNSGLLNPKEPVKIIFWHTYGQQMEVSMNELIHEFNETIGKERGIIVEIGFVADASEVNEQLLATANNERGARSFPDIAIIYPRIGVTLAERDLLMELSTQFSSDELSHYVPDFLEEGKLGGDTLYILPIAKSAEVIYLNQTAFDRFASDTDMTISMLSTMEGIVSISEKYYQWSGGKAFFYPVDPFNTAMIGMKQLGDDLIYENSLSLAGPAYERIWDAYIQSAVKGGTAVFDNYGNYLMATGETLCALGTSASITFYPDRVTYSDNTQEDIELAILPYPIFENGEKVSLQRGGGMCVFKSDNQKEYAAGIFLKWLTAPEQNLRFTAHTGYMPVTKAAFEDFVSKEPENVTEENVIKLFTVIREMQKEYTFYFPPVFDGLDDLQRSYNREIRSTAESSRSDYLSLIGEHDEDEAYQIVSQGVFDRFVERAADWN